MQKTKVASLLSLSALALGMVAGASNSVSAAADDKTRTTQAHVSFKTGDDTNPVHPLDPNNPGDEIDPIDPTDPSKPVDPARYTRTSFIRLCIFSRIW